MIHEPKVSIIIPVYNTEKYLTKCVNSVINQSLEEIQIILVDDESTDSSGELCESLKEIDSRIIVVHKKNGGLGYARNTGLEYATGEFVSFLDSDDWIEQNHLENLYEKAISAQVDLVLGGVTHVDNDGNYKGIFRTIEENIYINKEILGSIILPMIAPNENEKKDIVIPMSVCFNLYNLDIIKMNDLHFISEKQCLAEDLFFNLDYLNQCTRVYSIPTYGYNYRENPISISRKYRRKRADRGFVYYNMLIEKIYDLGISNEVGNRIERNYIGKIRSALKLIEDSDMGINEKYYEIKRILNNYTVKLALHKYPLKNYRLSLRITSYMMKYQLILPLLLAFKLRKLR
ncbi:MAG: glycosyltransferase family 2 protein [Aminipila sp.]